MPKDIDSEDVDDDCIRGLDEEPEGILGLGLAYKGMEKFDEAIEKFQQAGELLYLHETRAYCQLMIALCLREKGDPDLAMPYLVEAQRLYHEKSGIFMVEAQINFLQGNFSVALECAKKCQELNLREDLNFRGIDKFINEITAKLSSQ